MIAAGFLALGLLAAADAPTPSIPAELRGAALIDSVVARVDRHPITRSQLDLEARLAFARHGEEAKAEGPLSGQQLQGALDYLIDQILLDDEAERLGVFEVPEDEGRAEVLRLSQRFSSRQAYQAFLDGFGITPDLVESSLRRALRAERYLSDKLRVQSQSGASPEQLQIAGRTLVSGLRARADVRVLTHFGDPSPSRAARDAGSEIAPAARALSP